MFTSKQRSNLKALASGIEPIGQIGKSGVTDNMVEKSEKWPDSLMDNRLTWNNTGTDYYGRMTPLHGGRNNLLSISGHVVAIGVGEFQSYYSISGTSLQYGGTSWLVPIQTYLEPSTLLRVELPL